VRRSGESRLVCPEFPDTFRRAWRSRRTILYAVSLLQFTAYRGGVGRGCGVGRGLGVNAGVGRGVAVGVGVEVGLGVMLGVGVTVGVGVAVGVGVGVGPV
jgi:hypothetical protein